MWKSTRGSPAGRLSWLFSGRKAVLFVRWDVVQTMKALCYGILVLEGSREFLIVRRVAKEGKVCELACVVMRCWKWCIADFLGESPTIPWEDEMAHSPLQFAHIRIRRGLGSRWRTCFLSCDFSPVKNRGFSAHGTLSLGLKSMLKFASERARRKSRIGEPTLEESHLGRD